MRKFCSQDNYLAKNTAECLLHRGKDDHLRNVVLTIPAFGELGPCGRHTHYDLQRRFGYRFDTLHFTRQLTIQSPRANLGRCPFTL